MRTSTEKLLRTYIYISTTLIVGLFITTVSYYQQTKSIKNDIQAIENKVQKVDDDILALCFLQGHSNFECD